MSKDRPTGGRIQGVPTDSPEQLEERVNAYESRLAEQERQLLQVQVQAIAWRSGANDNGDSHGGTSNLQSGAGQPLETDMGGPSISVNALDIMSDPLGRTTSFNMVMDDGGRGMNMDMFSADGMGNYNNPGGGSSGGPPLGMGNTDMFPLAGHAGPSGPSASPSGLSMRSFTDPRILPSDDIVRDLVSLYFRHIHPWAPFLSPADLPHSAPWDIVVHALVVVTLRYSTDVRLGSNAAQYRQSAKTHVLAHAIESTSLSSVQALALLALDLIGSEQGPSSWGILALLTRSAVHLGLAREDDSAATTLAQGMSTRLGFAAPAPSLSRTSIIPPPANWHEDESRRRLFWTIFCLDRYACVSTGWDFALPDFEIKRRLPCADEIWSRQVSLVHHQFPLTIGTASAVRELYTAIAAPVRSALPRSFSGRGSRQRGLVSGEASTDI